MSDGQTLNLSDIPGLGPVRQAALAEAGVTDLERLLAMSVAELGAVRGIGMWQARKIREFLRQHGLLVELEMEDGSSAMLVAEPQTMEEAVVLTDSLNALAQQEAVEEALEAQVELLTEAVEQAREEEEIASDPLAAEAEAVMDQGQTGTEEQEAAEPWVAQAGTPEPTPSKQNGASGGHPQKAGAGAAAETKAEAGDGEDGDNEDKDDEDEPESPSWREQLNAQREQLPETALALMEAIRQAAVIPQLTRQVTRLLITASEFVSESRPVSEDRRKEASEVMARAESTLQAAIEKRSFGRGEQKDLARRLRRRRKELEDLLEQG